MRSASETLAATFLRCLAAQTKPPPAVPEVSREFTPEGCCVDRVRWFDMGRGEVVEAITLATD